MDKYDLAFFFGAVLALCGAIILSPMTLEAQRLGIPLLLVGIIVMLVVIFAKSLAKPT